MSISYAQYREDLRRWLKEMDVLLFPQHVSSALLYSTVREIMIL